MQSKGDTILFLKQIHFNLNEIREMTVPQVYLYIQRYNEPFYKNEIDRKIQESKSKE